MKTLMALALSMCAQHGFAALGGSPSSFGADRVSSEATTRLIQAASYTRVKTTLASGTEVLEYLDANGVVFAVAWSGPFLPDLAQLLGGHFQPLVQQSRQRPHGIRSRVVVNQPDVMILSGGRMGSFEGRAWVPALLPAGFAAADIK